MDKPNEIQDSPNPDDGGTTDNNNQPEDKDVIMGEDGQPDYKAMYEKKNESARQLHARATKAEGKLKKARDSFDDEQPADPQKVNPSPDHKPESGDYVTRQELEETRLAARGYNDDEIRFIMRNGGSEALNDKYVQASLKTMRDEQETTDATPSGEKKSPVYKNYTADELQGMSSKELEKLVPH